MKRSFFVLCLFILIFYYYKDILSYYFISDDFFYLSFNSLKDTVKFYPGFYHYNPVFWLIIFGLKKIFGLNPFPYHLIALLLHMVNSVLVCWVTQKLTRSFKTGMISALIFSLFFSQYEVVYWITGISTSIMVLFYLCGLISLIYGLEKHKFLLVLFTIFFLLAYFSHEYAISLLPVGFLSSWLIPGLKRNKRLALLILIVLTFFVMSFSLLRWVSADMSLFAHVPTMPRFFASFLKSNLYLFLPFPLLIDQLPKALILFLSLLIDLILIYQLRRNGVRLFLFLWMLVTEVIFSFTSAVQARYIYLSSIPSIIFLSSITLQKQNEIFKILFYIYLLLILTSGMLFLSQQKNYWVISSNITKQVLFDIKTLYPALPKNNIYFVNLPDSSVDSIWKAYVFRNGMEDSLRLIYPNQVVKIHYLKTDTASGNTRDDPVISDDKLDQLRRNKEIVLIYQENLKTITK